MLALIRDLARNKGVNLIVSSHLLPDIEFTCDHVIVMDKGAVATQGALDTVRGPQGRVFELRVKEGGEQMAALLAGAGYECHDTEEDVMRVFVPGDVGPEAIFRLAAAHGLQVRHLRQSVPTLEDAFARAVGAE
jgi:ABC-2 type transport system ATP-binding protein